MESEEIEHLNNFLETVIEDIDALDEKREAVLRLNRRLNRMSGKGIALLVRGNNPKELLKETEEVMTEIAKKMQDLEAMTGWSPLVSGVEEYCEFRILHGILQDGTVPLAGMLKAPSWIWVVSLGDVIGELRRFVLGKLLEGEIEEAEKKLGVMDTLYTLIAGLEFPKAVTGSLRNKVDVARTLLERTQSDLLRAKD